LTRNSKDFDSLARQLGGGRRIVALDSRGRGKSDYDPDYMNYSLVQEASDALSLLSLEFARPALIIGTSRGGLLSMIIHGVRADLIAGIVLNDIGPEFEVEGLTKIMGYLGVTPEPLDNWEDARAAMKSNHGAAFPNLSDTEWDSWARRTFKEENGALALDYDPKLRNAALETSAPISDFWPQFRRMADVPMLLLRGENSDLLSQETVQQMRRTKPEMRVVVMRERGHVPFLDEPEAVSAITGFLEELDTGERE